jgi:hypothetical protein
VAGVEDDAVVGIGEDSVERQGQLDDAEVRAQVSAGAADRLDQPSADLTREVGERVPVEILQVRRPTQLVEHSGLPCGRD